VTDVTLLDKLCGVPYAKDPFWISANRQTAPDTVNIQLENKMGEEEGGAFYSELFV
jgi:hypothetical protein